MAQRRDGEEMVVMVPFMAQGHLIPFMSLALQIVKRFGYKIIYVNTPLNIKKLHSSLPPNPSIILTELSFCGADHGLPPGTENTDSLPPQFMPTFLEASVSLKPHLKQLISDLTNQHGHPPLCIISDMFFGWSLDVAREFNIFHASFHAGGAYGLAVYYSLYMNLPHCKTDSEEFTLPDFPEVSTIHRSQLSNNLKRAKGNDPSTKYIQKYMPLCFESDGMLIATIEELDQTGMQYCRRKMEGRPVWPILPSFGYQKSDGSIYCIRPQKQPGGDPENCFGWLDTQPEKSVIFVSFGSQNTISTSQMMELAMGLEASGRSFIWAVRPPLGFNVTEEFRSEWLPEGYEAKMKELNRGLIVHKWAPQVEILSHKSTCAFLSHCGWNSVLESLSHGVPILGWPLSGEQHFNSKFLEEEVGVCIEVGRGTTCEIKHENIKTAIELVMDGSEKGMELKKKACEVKQMITDAIREEGSDAIREEGSAIKALEGFIKAALAMRK